ncbi:MAG TPA: hypothetical protein VH309_11150 [Elusimicrobiota bacterium]|jgi:hypothetical protein|nr:hypothetical protein [Elusimicrobiota bacterium]
MKLVLFLPLLALCPASRAASAPAADPLIALMTRLTAPSDGSAASEPGAPPASSARLARVQADLAAAAADFESRRPLAPESALRKALAGGTDPALRPLSKDRDASLNAIYRTLAVLDYTWALRFPGATCSPEKRRGALLRSADGLFIDPDVGTLSPWMARLLGPASFGTEPEEALDQASAATRPTQSGYEKLRARADLLTEELAAGKLTGTERAGLYCGRASAYERLALAHAKGGTTLASLSTGWE